MKNNKYSSRRKTPWDGKSVLTPTQSFIKDKYLNRYDYRHPKLSETNESLLINSFKPDCCPKCGSVSFHKDGFDSNNIQKYRCNDCGKRFTVITGTIFDNHKISISEWIDYLLELFGFVSFSAISKGERIADSTTKYWLIKLFDILEHYQDDIMLKDKVYLDETFYRVIKKDIGDKLAKGENVYCIGMATDSQYIYGKVECRNRNTTIEKTYMAFKDHILEGSTLIHDKALTHSRLIEELDLISETHYSKEKGDPLKPINDVHSLYKQFLNSHRGFNRSNLQDYTNLFCFIYNPPYNKLEKIELLLNMAITHKKCLRYRDVFSKNSDKQ